MNASRSQARCHAIQYIEPTPAEEYATRLRTAEGIFSTYLYARHDALISTLAYLAGRHRDDDAALGAAVRQLWDAYREVTP